MSEQIKEPVVTEPAVEPTEPAVSLSILEKVAGLFKKDEPPEPAKPAEPAQDDEFNNRVKEEVGKVLGEVIPKIKKTEKDELEKQKADLAKKQADLKLNSELEKVDPAYKEFVTFQLQQTGKTVDEFLAENNQYKTKVVPKGSNVNTSTGAVLEGRQKQIQDNLKKQGG